MNIYFILYLGTHTHTIRHIGLLEFIRVGKRMNVAFATNVVLILWLVIATTYWKSSQCVTSHPWECIGQTCFEKELTFKTIAWYDLHNVHLCLKNKDKHYPNYCSNNYSGTKHAFYYRLRLYEIYSYLFRMHKTTSPH